MVGSLGGRSLGGGSLRCCGNLVVINLSHTKKHDKHDISSRSSVQLCPQLLNNK